MRYIRDDGVRPVSHIADPSRRHLPVAEHRVRFHDLRGASPAPSLEREGLALFAHRSRVKDFGDPAEIERVYLTELERLMRQVTGSTHVYVQPMAILRSPKHSRRYGREVLADGTATLIHSDYTDRSVWPAAEAALRRHGVGQAPEGRLVAYNLWRAISPPPQDVPLAVCDRRTLRQEHLVRADSYGTVGAAEPRTEFYVVRHDPGHRWCYFSNMTRDELLVFQQHDTGAPEPSGCPHTAFSDPTCPAAVPPRLSIEARAFVFFD